MWGGKECRSHLEDRGLYPESSHAEKDLGVMVDIQFNVNSQSNAVAKGANVWLFMQGNIKWE